MLRIFSGTSHPKLSEEVAQLLGLEVSPAEITRFGNSEVKVTIQEDVSNDTCVVIQPTSNPTNDRVMELCLFCDALRRQEAKRVIGIVPWFGYAKQNIQHRPGECVSVNVVIRMLEALGFHKIYTFDIHDEGSGGIFTIPYRNLSALPTLAQKVREYTDKQKIKPEDVVMVSPDQGAVEKVRNFGTVFYGNADFSEAVIEKHRDQNIAHKAKPLDLYGDVKGKTAIIVDDMVVSGSTLIPAIDLCLERGAKQVIAAVVHHDFTKTAASLIQNSKLTKFFATNTIALDEVNRFEKFQEVSIASLIAEELNSFKK